MPTNVMSRLLRKPPQDEKEDVWTRLMEDLVNLTNLSI